MYMYMKNVRKVPDAGGDSTSSPCLLRLFLPCVELRDDSSSENVRNDFVSERCVEHEEGVDGDSLCRGRSTERL